ncbi:MAG: helix-turn-helix domain containing protein [Verrucomicrobia bacterium]|nr:helix-turn-helix domain containing protein [Verrucomicrobiota bacterium]
MKSTPAKKKRAYRTPAHRLRSVRLVLNGRSTVEVAKVFGDSQTAVSKWVRNFKKEGFAGLKDAPRSGRPSAISPSRETKLRDFVARARAKSQRVSGGVLAAVIKNKFGVILTRRQCERIIKRISDDLH